VSCHWRISNLAGPLFSILFGAVAAIIAMVAGCQDTNSSPRTQQFSSATSRQEMNDENLNYAFSVLRNTEEFQTPEALTTVVERLNQWIGHKQPFPDWAPDPLLEKLPDELLDSSAVRNLRPLRFPAKDAHDLQQTVWLAEIANRARGPDSQPLAVGQGLFDWVVRNIQIERDNTVAVPHLPRETLLLGRGTAADRAWLFSLLARQQGLDVVMLGLSSKEAADEPRFWLPALFVDGELYLFDTRLGLPIAGPDGKPVATLKEVLADEKLLRSMDLEMDLPQQRPYPVRVADLERIVILLEASPVYLSHRMQLVESDVLGKETLTLTVRPSALAARVATHPNVASVQLWQLPYERIRAAERMERETQQKAQAEFFAFGPPTAVLLQARVLHLMGSFDGDKGANALYQMARPPEADMKQYREKAPEQARAKVEAELAHFQAAKQSSSYFLGLVAFERGNYEAAVDYLQTRTLAASPDGPWTGGARYNLARAFEALGQIDNAVRYYRADLSAQRHGNLLRARRLETEATRHVKPANAAAG
jgi:hypothetical protein